MHIPWDNVTFLCYCPKIINHILQRLLHNTTAAQGAHTQRDGCSRIAQPSAVLHISCAAHPLAAHHLAAHHLAAA